MEKEGAAGLKANLLKASEVASLLNISKGFVYKLMHLGEIRSVRMLGARRVRPEDLDEFIRTSLQPPEGY